jgi:hypothetical protein
MAKSYTQKMRDFRGKSIQAANPVGGLTTPLSNVKKKSLSKRKTIRSLSKSRARSQRRHSSNERHPSMKRKRKANRKRDAKGHFIKKKSRTKRRRNPVAKANPRRRRAKRRVAKRKSGVVRVKRGLGRKRKSGRFVKRSRHRVRGFKRKVPGKRRKKLVRSHLSYEAAPNPRRRRRKRRVAAEEETPMKRRRRRARKNPAAPRRRRRRAAVRENPVRRRRRRRAAAEAPVRRRRRRRSVARANPRRRAARKPARKRCRTRSKRCVYVPARRRRAKRRTSARRRSAPRRTPRSHRLGAGTYLQAGPEYIGSGEYAMENPLSGGELGLAFLTGTVGYVLTDMLDRWLAVKELAGNPSASPAVAATALATNGTAMSPSMAALTKPGIWRVLAQAGAAAVPLAGAYWIKEPLGRAALQGAGLGALIHLGSSLLTHFVIAKWAGGSAPTAGSLQQSVSTWYGAELQADNASDLATTGTNGTLINAAGTVAGPPRGLAARPGVTPRALGAPKATGVGNCAPCNAVDPTSIVNPPVAGQPNQQPPAAQYPQSPPVQTVSASNGTTGGLGLAGLAAAFEKASAVAATHGE